MIPPPITMTSCARPTGSMINGDTQHFMLVECRLRPSVARASARPLGHAHACTAMPRICRVCPTRPRSTRPAIAGTTKSDLSQRRRLPRVSAAACRGATAISDTADRLLPHAQPLPFDRDPGVGRGTFCVHAVADECACSAIPPALRDLRQRTHLPGTLSRTSRSRPTAICCASGPYVEANALRAQLVRACRALAMVKPFAKRSIVRPTLSESPVATADTLGRGR